MDVVTVIPREPWGRLCYNKPRSRERATHCDNYEVIAKRLPVIAMKERERGERRLKWKEKKKEAGDERRGVCIEDDSIVLLYSVPISSAILSSC